MDFAEQAGRFRAAVKALGPRGRTTAYPRALRQEAVVYARVRRAKGAPWGLIAQELDVGGDSLRRWAKEVGQPEEVVGTFRSVKLVDAAAPGRGAGLVVHGPGGVRVEGLDVASVAELLRRLS